MGASAGSDEEETGGGRAMGGWACEGVGVGEERGDWVRESESESESNRPSKDRKARGGYPRGVQAGMQA